ncbi:E3 ubiquitin-protein ligase TRIM39-like [Coregonus clupeaformis]|uniref:E3 ubiquitin-protein ligase TRIM39-like n=1 Tax=Coregonus clupeaformis TaxID=59861 RepID=UPI001E1C2735|nr:E3 ubiquitin-protein ligase TRIM39-like [Coregonus clupeaformis]
MASSSSLSRREFLCSICLDVFTEPVTTSCGHNFCMACITKYWNSKDLYQCPLCQEKFSRRPKLCVNTTFREVIENFKNMRDRVRDGSPPKPKIVPCDVCTEEKQKAVERQAEGLIKELEQEITELKRRSTELKQLSHSEDHLQLLQSFLSLVCNPPPTKSWSEISVHSDLFVGTVRRAVSQLEETLNKEMEKLPGVKLKRIQQYAVDVTLEPDTAHPSLILSEDGKQVRYGNTLQNISDNPKRFDCHRFVLGKDGFSSGRFYYEVTVKGKTRWNLGVARESTDRKGIITPRPEDGLWTVSRRDENVYLNGTLNSILSLTEKPQKVGVFVDYEEGQVSFYDVEARSHIYSFTGCTFTEKLFPCLGPSDNDDGQNSAPLIISPVNHTH